MPGRLARSAIASAESRRPAPSTPSRLPVEALTLTAVAVEAEEAAIASRIASRWRRAAAAPR